MYDDKDEYDMVKDTTQKICNYFTINKNDVIDLCKKYLEELMLDIL